MFGRVVATNDRARGAGGLAQRRASAKIVARFVIANAPDQINLSDELRGACEAAVVAAHDATPLYAFAAVALGEARAAAQPRSSAAAVRAFTSASCAVAKAAGPAGSSGPPSAAQ